MSTKYNPYSLQRSTTTVNRNSWASSQVSCESKLDKVTRSRNALIIALAVFVAAFLACLIVILLNLNCLLPAPTPTNEESIQVISTLTNQPYGEELSDPNNYAFKLMNTTMCTNIIDAASSAGKVLSCDSKEFSDANPGVKGTVIIRVSLDGQTVDERFQSVSDAIVRDAAANPDWEVAPTDVTLLTPST